MSVADRIAVMNKGKVEQFDTPVAIYDRPRTLFVNGFIGTICPRGSSRTRIGTFMAWTCSPSGWATCWAIRAFISSKATSQSIASGSSTTSRNET